MSSISAGTTSGTALVSTGNTDGTIQLQVNGTTPSVTLAANGAVGVGSTPGYGTNGQVLTSAGTGSAPTWSTVSAGLSAATQAEMETATSNTVAATPLATNWHPGVAKTWIMCNAAGAIQASHNVTSITDGGVGQVTITIATDFSTANYCVMVSVKRGASGGTDLTISDQTAGTFTCSYNLSGTGAIDPDNWFAAAFGDQA